MGTIILLLLTGFSYTLGEKLFKEKTIVFFKSVFGLLFIFGLFAFVNENYTKPILKRHRPSHEYILLQENISNQIDSLYKLSKAERSGFFDILIKSDTQNFKHIDPLILKHWIQESGFSFPSGHSFNAFLLAMVLAYGIYHNQHKPKWKSLFVLPFIWALAVGVSRVAIGVHTPLDVSTGAAMGVCIGSILLYIDITRHWLTRSKLYNRVDLKNK